MFKTKLLSSLEKVFPDQEPTTDPLRQGIMCRNEMFSFQVAYYSEGDRKDIKAVRIESEIADHIRLQTVGLIPVEFPVYPDHDDYVLRTTPGLYPDVLRPLPEHELRALPNQWRSLWVSIEPQVSLTPGEYTIEISFVSQRNEVLARENFVLEVIDAELPPQILIHTQWLHTDCIATWYDVQVFSPEYWGLVEEYIATAVHHGINMILTPLFTPPLDTLEGGERPTVQLVKVIKEGGKYSFDFTNLTRWVQLCNRLGVEYFEFSHLFTQWGARHAPKIMAWVDGRYQRIFGWETDATGPEYRGFLDQFLPELVNFIRENDLEHRSYFHISDEPSLKNLDSYGSASKIMAKHLEGFPIIDALSAYEFYKHGLVKNPVPATNEVIIFLENNVPDLWTYYCGGHHIDLSQRFMAMPSARNRVLGYQLYKFGITGFLHWGYNFYYSQHSRFQLDPFRETDGGSWVPAGDAFVVYPGSNGPLESLRLKVLMEGLQDMRALQLLESLIGKERTLEILEDGLTSPLTFSEYPHGAEWILETRSRIYAELKRQIQA